MSTDIGIKISADGIDVKTGADKDMVATSKYAMLKGSIAGNGEVTIPRDGTTTSVTVAHNLGYIPSVQAFWNDKDFVYFNSDLFFPIPTLYLSGTLNFTVKADSTNIYLNFTINDLF